MTTIFVSRHPGAIEWIKEQALHIDKFVDHLDVESVNKGDTVIGVLPVSVAYLVCKKGAAFISLEIQQTRETRGQELSKDLLTKLNCRLQAFDVVKPQNIHNF
ncbi:CRISPR-associated protein Csx16 [uncultured Turicimonas sp.]|uniref:CRISPR-associated protein Csx16 n=1 Tax=uncultured Turicimonas sp. TaxID=1918607 RepID=UPI0032119D37